MVIILKHSLKPCNVSFFEYLATYHQWSIVCLIASTHSIKKLLCLKDNEVNKIHYNFKDNKNWNKVQKREKIDVCCVVVVWQIFHSQLLQKPIWHLLQICMRKNHKHGGYTFYLFCGICKCHRRWKTIIEKYETLYFDHIFRYHGFRKDCIKF